MDPSAMSMSLSTLPTSSLSIGSQPWQAAEFAMEIIGAAFPAAHSKGPQVMWVASPAGITS